MKKQLFVIGLCFLGSLTFAQRDYNVTVSLGVDSATYFSVPYEMRQIEVENVDPDRKQKKPTKAVIWRNRRSKGQKTVPLGYIKLLKDDTSKTSLYQADTVPFRLNDAFHKMSPKGYLLDSLGRPIEALIIRPLNLEMTERITFGRNHMTKNVRPKARQLFLVTPNIEWGSQEGPYILPGIQAVDIDVADNNPKGAYAFCVQDWWGRKYGNFDVELNTREGGVKMMVYEPSGTQRIHFSRDKRGHVVLDGKIRVRKIGVMRKEEKTEYKGVKKVGHTKRERESKEERKRKSERAPDVIQY